MDIERHRRAGAVSWAIAITMLVAVAGAQVYQIALATTVAGRIDLPERKYMHRLAWQALVVLSTDLVVLFWLTLRFFAARGRRREAHRSETPYVDAWAAAGQRLELGQGDDDQPPDESDAAEE